MQGFEACDEDGNNELTWMEVAHCIVSHFNRLRPNQRIHGPELCPFQSSLFHCL